MTPDAGPGPGGLRAADHGAASDTRRILAAVFAVVVVGSAAILLLLGRSAESEVAEVLVRSDLEDKASRFSAEAQRLLKGSALAGYYDRNQPGFERFQSLLEDPGPGDEGGAFVHVQDESGETILFRGPDLVQKLTVRPDGYELLEGDGKAIRQMVLQEGEGPPRYVRLEKPLAEALGPELSRRSDPSPEDRLRALTVKSRERLRRRLLYTSLGVLLTLASGFGLLAWQLARIRRLEAEVAHQRQLALLGTVASGLAHEIRNPLNGIGLNLHLLEESLAGADERLKAMSGRFLGRIRPAVSHLERVVNEFLEFARPSRMQPGPVDLGALVREVVEFLEPEAKERGVAISAPAPERAVVVAGDRERLRQVLLNLARNAFQAMERGGNLRLELGRGARDSVEIRVRDDGPGVPEEVEPRLFELFFTTRTGGVGLGLPIVRRVVEDHGGTVRLERDGRPGACFLVVLPIGRVGVM